MIDVKTELVVGGEVSGQNHLFGFSEICASDLPEILSFVAKRLPPPPATGRQDGEMGTENTNGENQNRNLEWHSVCLSLYT